MRRMISALVLVLVAGTAAAPALATHYTDVLFAADCTQWNAEVGIKFYVAFTEVDVDYDVAIEDLSGNVILATTGTATIQRNPTDFYGSVLLGDLWDNATDEIIPLYGAFVVHATFTLDWSPENPIREPVYEDRIIVECSVVPNEPVSWSTAKTQYR